MRIDLVSFDLDGTLVDSADEIARAVNAALADHGIGHRADAEIRDLIGGGTRELILKLLARCFLEQPSLADRVPPDAVLASMDTHYAQLSSRPARLYPGAPEVLRRLKDDGLRLACVTNKELRHAQRLLDAASLERHFDIVVGGDSLPHKKPHAAVLRHVARALGVDIRACAHVGDSAIDVQAARNAGAAAWAVPYGYNGGVPVVQSLPDRMFDTLAEVAHAVLATRATAPGVAC